jgi:8-oxo-dGTP pyrophosphatase MutT (NUDIX family)
VRFSIDEIATRLSRVRVEDPTVGLLVDRRAAVAAVLRVREGGPEVLLIERSEREGDRWSGHVAMPGGREDEGDVDLRATAMRETREEVGLELSGARLLGRLPPVRAIARGKILPMTISPFVFGLAADGDGDEPALTLSDEAVAAFWLPLGRAASGALDDKYEIKVGPLPMKFACWRWQGRVVWGLTYQMLRSLIAVLEEG